MNRPANLLNEKIIFTLFDNKGKCIDLSWADYIKTYKEHEQERYSNF